MQRRPWFWPHDPLTKCLRQETNGDPEPGRATFSPQCEVFGRHCLGLAKRKRPILCPFFMVFAMPVSRLTPFRSEYLTPLTGQSVPPLFSSVRGWNQTDWPVARPLDRSNILTRPNPLYVFGLDSARRNDWPIKTPQACLWASPIG